MSDNLDTLFERFMREQRISGAALSTLRGYDGSYKRFKKLTPDASIENIDEDKILDFCEKLRSCERKVGKTIKSGVENTTIRTYRNKLGSFFNWLVRKGIIEKNPFKELKMPNIIEKGRKYLNSVEIDKILATVGFNIRWQNDFVKKRNLAIIFTALLSGLRRREILGLKVYDIDLKNNFLTVRGEESKSQRNRSVPLHPILQEALINYLEERNKKKCAITDLFVSNNGDIKFTEHGLKHFIEKIIKETGLNFHIHQFRHTFAANMRKNKHDIMSIQDLLGHADIRMTREYLKGFPAEETRACVNSIKLDKLL